MLAQFQDVSKIYQTNRGPVKAIDNINMQINKGEFVIVRGASGSGKTTLLLALGGMLHPTKGNITVAGKNIYDMNDRLRARFRAENVGFVFQMFHLVPYLNVLENVLLSAGVRKDKKKRPDAETLLSRLNISGRKYHRPSELSAGEKQRTAIARALLNNPEILLADEPTGNLDPENAAEVIGYLSEFHKEGGTVIVVTHGNVADQYADRIIHLKEGYIV